MLFPRLIGPIAKRRFPTFTKLTTCANLPGANTPPGAIIDNWRPIHPCVSRRMASGLNGSRNQDPWNEDVSYLRYSPFWGFLIYRCDYRSDSAWNKFMQKWSTWAKEYTDLHYPSAGYADRLIFTVKEDKVSLDGASVGKIHGLFSKWTRSEEAFGEYREVGFGHVSRPRYTHCVHVDANALDSCLKWFDMPRDKAEKFYISRRDAELGVAAHVNVIRVEKAMVLSPELTEMVLPGEAEDEEFENDEDDQGPVSIKLHLPYVLPDMYARLFHVTDMSRWAAGFVSDEDGVCSW
ncbi:hypothetical protein HBH92_073650 [Parastagonospora nodorum]|nr:hypothetical protein HBH92_073650 [Parastagonospora nodorum]KAH4440270.1 hypothetical protein HBH93_087670 [Parastagonospora nodorum]KAH4452016.1 hypothetical protein HBH91_115910 [Parastagonospora nodorum]KAH4508946.1 hypothetical protein HBH89_058740 [Parastagonospora nodorum]KAH4546960.1 hypothetical protein HBH85_073690 [Parastagonospora nodorum]